MKSVPGKKTVVLDFVMNLPHDYYPAIGEFMFRSAQLEAQMHQILWRVLNIGNVEGRMLTIGTDLRVVRAMLRTAVSDELRDYFVAKTQKRLIQEICTLVSKSKDHVSMRNKLAHGGWEYPLGGKPSEARLVFMKEFHEKYLARTDPSVDAEYLHNECRKLMALNMRAKVLAFDLLEFRGIDTTRSAHGRKDFR